MQSVTVFRNILKQTRARSYAYALKEQRFQPLSTCCWKPKQVRTSVYLKFFQRITVSQELDLDISAHGCKLEVKNS